MLRRLHRMFHLLTARWVQRKRVTHNALRECRICTTCLLAQERITVFGAQNSNRWARDFVYGNLAHWRSCKPLSHFEEC